jgi:hypothetical protein
MTLNRNSKLFAIATEQKSPEAVKRYRKKPFIPRGFIGERFDHRGWPPDVVRAFLNAFVIRPEKGEIQRKLYGAKG